MKLLALITCLSPLLAGAPLTLEEDRAARWEEWIELGLHRPLLLEADEALATSTATPELLALAARAAAAAGERDRARAWLARAEGAAIELERARLHLEDDHIDEALALLLTRAEPPAPRHPERSDAWILSARAFARAGELERARPFLEIMIARFPHDDEAPAALHLLAQVAIARGDRASAQSLRRQAAKASRWRAFFDARRRQALEHPLDPLPRFGIAALWMEAGEPAKASEVLDELLKSAADFARGHALLGDAARALGELSQSLASWSRALELDESLHAARLNRAILFINQSEWLKARADLEVLVELDEARKEPLQRAHLELARTLEALGDPDGARAARERYEALNRD